MYNTDWYNSLVKPYLAPPANVFAPVWTLIYTLIGISFLLFIFTKSEKNKLFGCIIFLAQMVLNFFWSPIFFAMQNIGLALAVIVVMDILVFINVKEFYKTSKISGALLIPYLAWLLFATYLNAGYFYLNASTF